MDNYHPEHTQPMSERTARAPASVTPLRILVDDPVVIHDIAQVDAELTCRLDAIGHTVCELDRADLKALLQLATCDRAALLAERRQYVIARRGDTSRFVELLKTLDTKIEAATKLTDKLARLYAVKS